MSGVRISYHPPYPHDLLILRHGQTEWNAQDRLQGNADSPLTPLGRSQADRQRAIVQELDAVSWAAYCSPQGRALHTAEIVLGDTPTVDARLREIEIGQWTGRTRAELILERPDLFEADGLAWYDHAPDGEGLASLARRTGEFLESLKERSVIITHGITSRMLRCHALGLPWEAFETLDGGQGVVHRISDGGSQVLS